MPPKLPAEVPFEVVPDVAANPGDVIPPLAALLIRVAARQETEAPATPAPSSPLGTHVSPDVTSSPDVPT